MSSAHALVFTTVAAFSNAGGDSLSPRANVATLSTEARHALHGGHAKMITGALTSKNIFRASCNRLVTAQEVYETGSRYFATAAIWLRVDVTCIPRSRRCKLLSNTEQKQKQRECHVEGWPSMSWGRWMPHQLNVIAVLRESA